MGFAEQIWINLSERFGHWAVLALISVASALAWVLIGYLRRKGQQFLCFVRSRRRTLNAVARERTGDSWREGSGVWLTQPILPPDDYKNLLAGFKVLAIANLKGGVGKTTISANLGACLAADFGMRVLLLDLDFQGSLSSMCFAPKKDWVPPPGQDSLSTKLISGDLSADLVSQVAKTIGKVPNGRGRLDLIPAYYDLAQADNRLMVEWLLRCRPRPSRSIRHVFSDIMLGRAFQPEDVRYTLARLLHSDAVRAAYDIVIIDCPPRLTTSEIQAFCAATHLLVPTIFDRTSAEAVVSLNSQVEILRNAGVCPNLRYLGVVGTKWTASYTVAKESLDAIQTALAGSALPILPVETFLPMTVKMVNNAEDRIAYLVLRDADSAPVRAAIRNLTVHIAGQMGLPLPLPAQPTVPPPAVAQTVPRARLRTAAVEGAL